MGTLLNQKPRYEARNIFSADWIDRVMCDLERLTGSKPKLSTDQALRVLELAQERERFTYWANDLDVKDEQLAGFGELLQELIEAVRELSSEDRHDR